MVLRQAIAAESWQIVGNIVAAATVFGYLLFKQFFD